MQWADLHCDTIGKCYDNKLPLYENSRRLSLQQGAFLQHWLQAFAIWNPEGCRGSAAQEYYRSASAYFHAEMRRNTAYVRQCRTPQEIQQSQEDGVCSAILTVEDAAAAAGKLSMLEEMDADGVCMITLTWNHSNELGHGALSRCDAGLTPFGRMFVKEMGRCGMVADVSHLNQRGFYDVADCMDTPMMASHSNAKAVWDHPRSLTDEQIQILIQRKGLQGVCFCQDFLGEPEQAGYEAVFRQLAHVLDLGGENILAMGSDFDGAPLHAELCGIGTVAQLWEYLLHRGIPQEVLQKIFYQNAMTFWLRNLQENITVV